MLDRYYNVLPYDHSRVRLKYLDREIYINANYVRVPEANRKYILTQGKLQISFSTGIGNFYYFTADKWIFSDSIEDNKVFLSQLLREYGSLFTCFHYRSVPDPYVFGPPGSGSRSVIIGILPSTRKKSRKTLIF